MVRFKFNNPVEDFCLGIHCHKCEKIEHNLDTDEITQEDMTRLILGFLIFNIEIIW